MRNSRKIASIVAIAGLVALGGSAVTAASTIDDPSQFVGATYQTISGIHVSSVAYTTNMTTDITSVVTFNVVEVLEATDVITATITGLDTGNSAGTSAVACVHTTASSLTCTFPGGGAALHDVTRLDIVAS
ncbi:hypothetical protein [Pengzhenrongella sp.]|uniref:hypothetical protein n=1 Tax=Pengzhenrongella sp. TaxID=2888820 RepID=UPI002F92F0DD